MSKRTILSFFPDGKVEFTRDPATLKLFEGEHLSIRRMTEIEFNEEFQKFQIKFVAGKYSGRVLSMPLYSEVWYGVKHNQPFLVKGPVPLVQSRIEECGDAPIMFKTYEYAVAFELKVVDLLRLIGQSLSQ